MPLSKKREANAVCGRCRFACKQAKWMIVVNCPKFKPRVKRSTAVFTGEGHPRTL